MSTYDRIEFTNLDGTKREMTEDDFSSHKLLECGCKISIAKGWPMTRFIGCKPDCDNWALWRNGEMNTDGEKMCRECCQTTGHAEWCSNKNQTSL